MRILILCKRHYTNKDLMSDRFGRLYHIPMHLGRHGQEVLVLAADYRSSVPANLVEPSVEFRSLPVSPLSLFRYLRDVDETAKDFEPDIVLASGDTPLGLAGSRLSRRVGARFVFDVYDNYQAFASARVPGMRRRFRSLVSSADLVLAVSESLRELLGPGVNSLVLSNGVDTEVFRPMDKAEQRARLGIADDEVIVGYVGGVVENRGIETLIEAVGLLDEPARLVLAGPVDGKVDHRGTDWVDYRGVIPHAEVASLINVCDVAVLPYPDSNWARYTNANKLHEYLACEVPVVVTDISDYRQWAASPEAVCRPSDPGDMARAIEFQLQRRAVAVNAAVTWEAQARILLGALQAL